MESHKKQEAIKSDPLGDTNNKQNIKMLYMFKEITRD